MRWEVVARPLWLIELVWGYTRNELRVLRGHIDMSKVLTSSNKLESHARSRVATWQWVEVDQWAVQEADEVSFLD